MDNEADYKTWLLKNPSGYVLTTTRDISPKYMSLHRASCRMISQYMKNMADNAFTGKGYIKICSRSTDDLLKWIKQQQGDGFSKRCSICNPDGDVCSDQTPQSSAGRMTWRVSCEKSSGELRAQFSQWSVPKDVRDATLISDGDSCSIEIEHSKYRGTFQCKITSGGEFRIPKQAAKELQAQANVSPDTEITFSIGFDVIEVERRRFQAEVEDSMWLSAAERKNKLDLAPKHPERYQAQVTLFKRNPHVVAEVLERAKGRCERCDNRAPFFRRDSSPYLEVHHKQQLAAGGEDTVENAIALCPNCHREQHYGLQLGSN